MKFKAPNQNYSWHYKTGIVVAIFVSVVYAVDYFRLPKPESLEKHILHIDGHFTSFTRGKSSVMVKEPGAEAYSVRCDQANSLCDIAATSPNINVNLQVIRLSVFGDYFAVYAKVGNRVVVRIENAAERFHKIKMTQLFQLIVICCGTALSIFFYMIVK